MAVPEPHGGPAADKDRDWHWSEQGASQVDAMLEKERSPGPRHLDPGWWVTLCPGSG